MLHKAAQSGHANVVRVLLAEAAGVAKQTTKELTEGGRSSVASVGQSSATSMGPIASAPGGSARGSWTGRASMSQQERKTADPRDHWMPDDGVDTCTRCNTTKFSLIVRKHHCRFCGQIVCDTCSERKAFYAGSGTSERCCDPCFEDQAGVTPRSLSGASGSITHIMNFTNTHGDTALKHAAALGHATVVKVLAEAGANVNGRNGHGESALDAAAAYGCEATVRALIQEGATGSGHGHGHAMIRRVRREELLLEDGALPPTQLRLNLSGFGAVGKSTLMRSLGRSKAATLLNRGSTAAPDRTNADERTPGIDVRRVDVPGVGWLSMWDFAGQPEYYMSHGLLMGSSSIYVVLCSLHDRPQLQQEQVMFWLRFIRARSSRQEPTASHHSADGHAADGGACSLAGILAWVRELLADAIDANVALPSWMALKAELAVRFPDYDVAGLKTQCTDMLKGADVDSGNAASETKDVTVWEQNRYYPVIGWSQKMLPSDRGGPYADHETDVVYQDLESINPPAGWNWVDGGGWVVDARPRLGGDSHGDKHGWAYASDWPREFRPKKSLSDFVRHRPFVREITRQGPVKARSEAAERHRRRHLPVVVIAGSSRDRPHASSAVTESSGGSLTRGSTWSSPHCNAMVDEATRLFDGSLNVEPRFFYLDCNLSHDQEMTALRSSLHGHRAALIEMAPKVPLLCNTYLAWLPAFRHNHKMVPTANMVDISEVGQHDENLAVPLSKFPALSMLHQGAILTKGQPAAEWVARSKGRRGTEDRNRAALAHLHDMGEIMYFENDPTLSDWIILDPQWFGQRVIGVILAPDTVRVTAPKTHRDGVISIAELKRVLSDVEPQHFEPVIAFLKGMGLCYPDNDHVTPSLVFPALLRRSGDDDIAAWDKASPSYAAWAGRRLVCVNEIDMLPPQYFPRLQARLAQHCRCVLQTEPPMWHTGTLVSQSTDLAVQCLITIDKDGRYVDLTARCRFDDERQLCLGLLDALVGLAEQARLEVAGGTQVALKAVSLDSLRQPDARFVEISSSAAQLGGTIESPTAVLDSVTGKVTVDCLTAAADIRYTLDGSDPNHNSRRYDGNPFLPGPGRDVPLSLKARAFKAGMIPSVVYALELPAVRRPPSPAPPVDSPVDLKAFQAAVQEVVREELCEVKKMQVDVAKTQVAMLDSAQQDREAIIEQQQKAEGKLDNIAAGQVDARQSQATIMSNQAAGTVMLETISDRQDVILSNQEDALLALAGLQDLAEETARVVLVIEPQVTTAVADMHRQTQCLLEADAVEREKQLELLMASTSAAQIKADEQRTALLRLADVSNSTIIGMKGSVDSLGDRQDEAIASIQDQHDHLVNIMQSVQETRGQLAAQRVQISDLAANIAEDDSASPQLLDSMYKQQCQLDHLRRATKQILDKADEQRALTKECISNQGEMVDALAGLHSSVAGVHRSIKDNREYITAAINQVISSKLPKVPFLFVLVPDGRGRRLFTTPKKWGKKEYRLHLLCQGRRAHAGRPKVDPHFLFDAWDEIKPKVGQKRGYSLLEPKAFMKRFGPYIKFILGALILAAQGAAFAFLPATAGLVPGLKVLFEPGDGPKGESSTEQMVNQFGSVCAAMVDRVDQERLGDPSSSSSEEDGQTATLSAQQQYSSRDGGLDIARDKGWRCPEAEYRPMPDEFGEFIKQQDTEKGHHYFGLKYYHNSKEGVGDGSGTPMWLCAECREGIVDMHAL